MKRYSLGSRGSAIKKKRWIYRRRRKQRGGGVSLRTVAAQTASKVFEIILDKLL